MDISAAGQGLFRTGWGQGTASSVPPAFELFIALGDSFTEGIGDPDPGSPGGYRGWADRVAEELGTGAAGFAYANLAVRGLLVRQVVEQQVGLAVALQPDLVTFQAGGNDFIHPGADPDRLASQVEPAVQALVATGAVVLMFVGPDSGPGTVLGRFRSKVAVYNENLRGIALQHGAVIADLWAMPALSELRMWDDDRLHLSALGHRAVAAMVLETLHVPHHVAPVTAQELQLRTLRQGRAADLAWTREYLLPWVIGGIRRRGVGTESRGKRPVPGPVGGAATGSAA
jgi:lysophospholipase L1-like esterase